MANLNKVMLIGRLTRDPEVRVFANGGKVAKFGFAVNNRKKDQQTGQWVDDPVFLEVDAFNRGDFGKLADLVESSLRKGHQVFLEGHLKLDQWTGQDGQKRSQLKVVLDNMQFLEKRQDGGGSYSAPPARRSAPSSAAPPDDSFDHSEPPVETVPPGGPGRPDEDIPF
jgi:single-strand DNA-binding protein